MADFEFPYNRELLPESIFIERSKVDYVREVRCGLIGRAARKSLNLNIGNCPRRTTHFDNLPRLWDYWDCPAIRLGSAGYGCVNLNTSHEKKP